MTSARGAFERADTWLADEIVACLDARDILTCIACVSRSWHTYVNARQGWCRKLAHRESVQNAVLFRGLFPTERGQPEQNAAQMAVFHSLGRWLRPRQVTLGEKYATMRDWAMMMPHFFDCMTSLYLEIGTKSSDVFVEQLYTLLGQIASATSEEQSSCHHVSVICDDNDVLRKDAPIMFEALARACPHITSLNVSGLAASAASAASAAYSGTPWEFHTWNTSLLHLHLLCSLDSILSCIRLDFIRPFQSLVTLDMKYLLDGESDTPPHEFFATLHAHVGATLTKLMVTGECGYQHCHALVQHPWSVLEELNLSNERTLGPAWFSQAYETRFAPRLRNWSVGELDDLVSAEILIQFLASHKDTLVKISIGRLGRHAAVGNEVKLWKALPQITPNLKCLCVDSLAMKRSMDALSMLIAMPCLVRVHFWARYVTASCASATISVKPFLVYPTDEVWLRDVWDRHLLQRTWLWLDLYSICDTVSPELGQHMLTSFLDKHRRVEPFTSMVRLPSFVGMSNVDWMSTWHRG
jgi:hypothetical protein